MRNGTKGKSKKTAPIICAGVIVAVLGAFLGTILYPLMVFAHGVTFAMIFLIAYGLIIAAVIIGVIIALIQRLKEIKGGEEDDASQY